MFGSARASNPDSPITVTRQRVPWRYRQRHQSRLCCFCHHFVKFPWILINFGRYMAKWLKLYAMYTFSTKPDPCHYTTLLNTDILNFYVKLDLLQSDSSDLVSKWRRHTVAATFLLRSHCQTLAGWARDTVAFMERERNASSSKRLCPCTRGTFRAWILTILSRSIITTNNSAE